jgi:hypothetical protein
MLYFSLIIDGKLVDLFQDESIQLNRQIKDYSKIDTVFTDFSQNFTIPATESNNKIFQNYFDENVLLQSWNQNFALTGEIYIHGLPVFTGEIELLEVKFKDGLPSSYNIVFYGTSKTLLVNWGEKTLPEIDWSNYLHTISNALAISSWTGGILGGSIIWDLKDYGYGYRYCKKSGGVSYDIGVQNTINYKGLRPSILLKDMIENIFTAEGFSLGGTLLSRPEFEYLYVTPQEAPGSYFDRINGNNYGNFEANDSAPQNIYRPTSTLNTWFALPVGNTVITGNTSGAWNNATYTYTCPETGQYSFGINITNYTPLTPPSFTPTLGVKVTVNGKTKGFYQNKTAAQWTSGGQQLCYFLRLSKGDVVQFIYNTPVDAVVDGSISCLVSPPTSQVLVDMARVMPEIKVSEFFNSVLQMFNAVLVPSKTYNFELHNIEDWYALGQNVEYTEFINFKNLTHKKMPVPSSITMKHKEGEALPQTFFKTTYKRNFGDITFRPDVDFSDEPIEFETVFQVNPITLIQEVDTSGNMISNTDIEMPFIINSESQGVDQKLILFYNGRNTNLKTVNNTFYVGTTIITQYPPSSPYSGYTTNSYSTAFGLEASLIGNMPKNSMYWLYWNRYLSRLYSTRSRIVIVDAVIPVGVWLNMKLNDNVAISGNYYKIQKIQYDLLSQKAVIELITYPNVSNLEITTTVGKKPTFTTLVATDNGKTFIDGNPIRKALSNSIESGGIYETDAIDIATFNISAQSMITPIMDNILPLVSLNKVTMWNYSSLPITVTPTAQAINLTDVGFDGDQRYYTYDLANSQITINTSGQYRINVNLVINNSSSAKVGWEVNIDGVQTEAYQETHANTILSINLIASATIGENQVVKLRTYTLDGSTKNINIHRISFTIERII